jgi:predicted GIY-YIG superfamily endonuclease
MTYGFIYKIQFPNGKYYIGLTTTSLEKRQREHKSYAKNGDTKVLYNALRKYNMVDTFELIEIDKAVTLEELCEKEILYIQEYNSYYMNGNGYNMTLGGEGSNGYVYTEEDRQIISEAQKKRFENPEEKEKLSRGAKNDLKILKRNKNTVKE